MATKLLKMQINTILFKFFCVFFIVAFSVYLDACSSAKPPEIRTADDLFKVAKEKYEKEDYEEASKLFDLLKLQYPASQYADDAQYYLAEISFKRGEYIMAAFHYNWLRRSYPNSSYSKESLYKTALCYYNLSPPFDRDQEYTFKAIEAFQDFQNAYPADSLYPFAGKYIKELRNKLAYRNYFVALLYYKWLSYKSALVYIDFILDDFSDTDYAEDAYWLKINIYKELKLFLDLKELFKDYRNKFPNGKYTNQISLLEKELANL